LGHELEVLQERMHVMTKKVTEITNTLLGELSSIGDLIGGSVSGMKRPEIENASQFDEEFTVARLYVSKLKTEVKHMVEINVNLTHNCKKSDSKLDAVAKEIQAYKLTIAQNEAKMQTLGENVKEVEAKKRTLEEAVDSLNEKLANQTAKEEMQLEVMKDKEEKHAKGMMDALTIKETLEGQMAQHRDVHNKQLTGLRDEIQQQSDAINQLKEINQRQELEEKQIKEENEKLHSELTMLKSKYQDLEMLTTKKEHAQKDLQYLEETVARELATLNKLRQMFVKDLQSRMKVITGEETEDSEVNSQAQKQKISFLENNLEQLTKVHKQLVRDNADLRLELPKLEKRLKATQERVKALEVALKDAKDGAMKDRSRYQKEVERLKQKSSNANRRIQPQIAKPIRPGQHTAIIRPGNSTLATHGSDIDSSRQQGSIVVRAASPSKIPIVPMNSAQTPIIKGHGYRDSDTSASGVSQRVKNAVGVEPLSRQRIRKPGEEAKRSSIHGEASLMKSSSSSDRLNYVESNGVGTSPKTNRRLPSPSSRSPLSQNTLSGREEEIRALMAGNRLPRSSHQNNSPSPSSDGSWDRRSSSGSKK